MTDKRKTGKATDAEALRFGAADALALHQLRILEWQARQKEEEAKPEVAGTTAAAVPAKWQLTQGVELYDWQKRCIDAWFAEGKRGTIKVVTGAGKTLLALAAAERLQNTEVPDLCVAVVAPTIVLMNQWYEELLERGNVPASAIGRLGGGYAEDFAGRRVLISVLQSARKFLPKLVEKAGVGDRLLFVADECHRVGATEMSTVLETARAFNMGLSATPERDEDEDAVTGDPGYDESPTGQALGRIIYELTYADALRLGIIPPFTIHHYGLPLSDEERSIYERLTRSINDARSELKAVAPGDARTGTAFYRWVRGVAGGGGESAGLASSLIADTSRRKDVLYRMAARYEAVRSILEDEFAANPDARVILFHERIKEAVDLFCRLRDDGFPVVAEHGELPTSIREEGLELFRKGTAKVMVSVKSLIEGFNVPAVDVGIIVASTSSVRQRIQSMGRVLRRHRTRSGEEKTSCIRVLYARDTVDDFIYSKLDWEHATGVDRNLYYLWTPGEPPVEQEGPPRISLPSDVDVDVGGLRTGDVYAGAYEGVEYTCDTAKNIIDSEGRYAQNSELAEAILTVRGRGGRFRVTPSKHLVLVRVPDPEEDWVTRYVCRLESELMFAQPEQGIQTTAQNIDDWVANASPGDVYPFTDIRLTDEKYQFRQKRGGVISKRVKNGEVFARVGSNASDPERGRDGTAVLAACRQLLQRGERVTHLEINEEDHVLYRSGGQLRFVYNMEKGLEFPEASETP